jgi:hypothetical protein
MVTVNGNEQQVQGVLPAESLYTTSPAMAETAAIDQLYSSMVAQPLIYQQNGQSYQSNAYSLIKNGQTAPSAPAGESVVSFTAPTFGLNAANINPLTTLTAGSTTVAPAIGSVFTQSIPLSQILPGLPNTVSGALPIVFTGTGTSTPTPIGFQLGPNNVGTQYNAGGFTFTINGDGSMSYAPAVTTAQQGVNAANNAAVTGNAIYDLETFGNNPLVKLSTAPGLWLSSSLAPALGGKSPSTSLQAGAQRQNDAGLLGFELKPSHTSPSALASPRSAAAMPLASTLISSAGNAVRPYLNNAASDINSYLKQQAAARNVVLDVLNSKYQQSVASNPYNITNPFTVNYWKGQLAFAANQIENLAFKPGQTIESIIPDFATAMKASNELVNEGAAPWYLPDAVMAMFAVPLAVSTAGGALLAGASPMAVGGLIGTSSAINAGLSAGGGYLMGATKPYQIGENLVSGAELGALTGAIAAPIAAAAPITRLANNALSEIPEEWALPIQNIVKIALRQTGKLTQSALDGATWFAANTALSQFGIGHIPTEAQLINAAEVGAVFGAALSAAGSVLSPAAKALYRIAARIPTMTSMPLDEYVAKFGETPEVAGLTATLTHFGADPAKAFAITDAAGNVQRFFYNDVHVGYASAQQLQNYLQDVFDRTGVPFKLASTTQEALKAGTEVVSKVKPEYLGGVRRYASAQAEGIYFDIPTETGLPIQLNYNPTVFGANEGSSSIPKVRFTLNPFKSATTLLSTEVMPSNIDLSSIAEFESTTGQKVGSPEGWRAFSQWLSNEAEKVGNEFYYPYQNYMEGPNEAQVMQRVGTRIGTTANQKVWLTGPNVNSNFVDLMEAQNLGNVAEENLVPRTSEEQNAAIRNYARALSESSGNVEYLSPFSSEFIAPYSYALGSSPSSIPSIASRSSSLSSPSIASSLISVPWSSSTSGSVSSPSVSWVASPSSISSPPTSSLSSVTPSYLSSSPYSGSYSFLGSPLQSKKDLLLAAQKSVPPEELIQAVTPPVAHSTQYTPSVALSIFPELASIGMNNPESPLAGLEVRNPLGSQARTTPTVSASTSATQTPLDAASMGTPTTRDLALEQAYQTAQLNSIIPANSQTLAAAANPSSLAGYQNTQAYNSMLMQPYQRQMLLNMQQDMARNYQNSLYGNEIFQTLGGSLTPSELYALINGQESLASSAYNNAAAPSTLVNVPGAYANPLLMQISNLPEPEKRRLALPEGNSQHLFAYA